MPDHRGLSGLTDAGSVSRGIEYARRGRARIVGSTTDPDTVQGLVRGSGGVLYETRAAYTLEATGQVTGFHGTCSCPVGMDCKHAVALLLTALNGRTHVLPPAPLIAPPAVPTPPAIPTWEKVLTGITDLGGAPPAAAVEPLGLAFELIVPTHQRSRWNPTHGAGVGEGQLAIRPVCLGAQGKWIRTGISWSELSHGYARWKYRPDHVRVLTAISRLNAAESRWSYTGTDPWIQLTSIGSTIWELLAECAEIGLALISPDPGQPAVALSWAPAELTVDVGRDAGGLQVAPSIVVGGEPVDRDRLLFLGDPAHGIATWSPGEPRKPRGLRLAALDHHADQPLRTLFEAGGVHVPAGDQGRFLDDFVPALRRRHVVRSVDPTLALPEHRPPVLSGVLTPMPGHGIRLDWSWIYRFGTGERRFPLTPAPGTDSGLAVDAARDHRDPDAEAALLAELRPLLVEIPRLSSYSRLGPTLVSGAVTSGPESIVLVGVILPRLETHPSIEMSTAAELPDYREATDEPVITLSSTPTDGSRDWFDLTVTVTVGPDEVPFEAVFTALANGDELMILPDGGYFTLDRPEFAQLRTLIEEARSLQDRPDGPLRISRFQAGLWDELERIGVVDGQSTEWLRRVNGWRADPELVGCAPPTGLQATLRPYQLDGFRWLNLLRENGLGGILADDMGLGKTVQTLAMIVRARELDPHAPPFLVVAPTSVVGNWRAEATKFAPGLQTAMITETATRRGVSLADAIDGADIVVTSYTLFRLEFDGYDGLPFAALILDEAQVVKNHQSKAFACVKRLSAPIKFAITGTPMENNLMELWALFNIVAPGLFPSPVRFNESYRVPIERGQGAEPLARLRRRIAPLMLRRTKEAVAADLPAKQEQILELELEPAHRKIYQRQLQRERQKILGLIGDLDKNRFAIFRSLMLLRQASIDPFLIDPANAHVPSTKLTVLMELLEDVISEGHRTLIFSQFTGFLARVRDRLDADGITYCYLDGSTRDRAAVLTDFREGTAPVFLISLKAGGVGLNLTEADYCILLDPWWNPAAEAQAVDRTHRIGQTKKVMVYRLVSKDTIEEKVMALKATKSALFAGVMAGEGSDQNDAPPGGGGFGKGITAADIRDLLG